MNTLLRALDESYNFPYNQFFQYHKPVPVPAQS